MHKKVDGKKRTHNAHISGSVLGGIKNRLLPGRQLKRKTKV